MRNRHGAIRLQGLVVLSFVLTTVGFPKQALSDITAANAHDDRAPFEACEKALGKLDDSVEGTRADATDACAKSMMYYAKKSDASKTEDDVCVNDLYAASSAGILGHILQGSLNQAGAKKASSLASTLLHYVIAHCPDEPNILRAANGELKALNL